ncbi:helix-turn-helix transcriptional regulator [Nocardioides sp. AX2bis]|uniref:helix-turn-helix transcriptional regulator n=1 Tax=Nocardioides sp. AX2bis TaxID=2653157 RepID=UPI0012F1444F|nr:helix-turn-helix transcriptional regulator [Nocardioides sp. AX2bis]VXB65436.1 Regulatory protein, luxR family [Nocardioides sp. AX2bis]
MLVSDPAVPVIAVGCAPTRALPSPDVRLRLAQDALRAGRVRDARAAFEVLVGTTDRAVAAPAREGLVDALLAQGELAAAAEVLVGVSLRPATGEAWDGQPVVACAHDLHAAGELAAAQGDPAAAVDLLHAAGAQAHVEGATTGPCWRVAAAFALARVGRRDEAVALAEEHLAAARVSGSAHDAAQALRVLAVLDTTGCREARLLQARRALDGVVALRLAAQVDTDLAGLLLLGSGGPADPAAQQEAVRLLSSVEHYALTEGLWPLLGRARRLLDASGTTASWPHLERLTASERRVVEPAAQGATNREIAAAAGISVKAVEWHLSRVYRKLGVTSRRALVDALGHPPL